MHMRQVSGWPRSGRAIAVSVGVAGLVLVLCSILCAALVAPYARYEMTHDLPNPYWGIFNRGYSYTPEQGPPNAVLLDTHPDVIAMQYLYDYLAVAGTYPCMDQLAGYNEDETYDPVISGQLCDIHRKVSELRVILVKASAAVYGVLKVDVRYQVDYADGAHLAGVFHISARVGHSQSYFFAWIHANCWVLLPAVGFYMHHSVSPPLGAEYFTVDGKAHCAGVN